jgi:hypothetical protein
MPPLSICCSKRSDPAQEHIDTMIDQLFSKRTGRPLTSYTVGKYPCRPALAVVTIEMRSKHRCCYIG